MAKKNQWTSLSLPRPPLTFQKARIVESKTSAAWLGTGLHATFGKVRGAQRHVAHVQLDCVAGAASDVAAPCPIAPRATRHAPRGAFVGGNDAGLVWFDERAIHATRRARVRARVLNVHGNPDAARQGAGDGGNAAAAFTKTTRCRLSVQYLATAFCKLADKGAGACTGARGKAAARAGYFGTRSPRHAHGMAGR